MSKDGFFSSTPAITPVITLGRYVAEESPVHRLDPRTKLLGYACLSGVLFAVNHAAGLCLVAAFLLLCAHAAHISPLRLLRGLIPFLWLFAITGFTHFFSTGGTSLPYFPIGPLDATWEGLHAAFIISAKLAIMVMGSMLLAATTAPHELTFGMERILSPLSLVGVNVTRWAAMLSLSIAFIPLLQEEADRLLNAHRSRGMATDRQNIIRKGREMSPIIPLLFTRLFTKAAQISEAFSGRGWQEGSLSAAVKEFRFHRRDLVACGITLAVSFVATVL